jgi:hypothetical protein
MGTYALQTAFPSSSVLHKGVTVVWQLQRCELPTEKIMGELGLFTPTTDVRHLLPLVFVLDEVCMVRMGRLVTGHVFAGVVFGAGANVAVVAG